MLNKSIIIPKKDYIILSLVIKNEEGRTKLDPNDLLYFSVKENANDTEYKIQKTLGNGIEYNEDTGNYDITIESEDTKDMIINKTYGYDIVIYYNGDKPKRMAIGHLKITEKYTMNGVVVNE